MYMYFTGLYNISTCISQGSTIYVHVFHRALQYIYMYFTGLYNIIIISTCISQGSTIYM